MEAQETSFVMACKNFFGFKEDQTPSGFAAEIKALTPKDRADLTTYFEGMGLKIKAE